MERCKVTVQAIFSNQGAVEAAVFQSGATAEGKVLPDGKLETTLSCGFTGDCGSNSKCLLLKRYGADIAPVREQVGCKAFK